MYDHVVAGRWEMEADMSNNYSVTCDICRDDVPNKQDDSTVIDGSKLI